MSLVSASTTTNYETSRLRTEHISRQSYQFRSLVPHSLLDSPPRSQKIMNTDIPIPDKIDVRTTFDGITISRKWFSLKAIPLAIFAAVWDSFLFFWYSTAFNSDDAPWIMIVFPLGHVAVGIGITYFAISSFLNKTDISISPDELKVKTSPLKWIGDKTIRTSDIQSLSIREKNGENGSSYTVFYVDTNNRQRKLISNLSEPEHADYYLLKIQQILGIDANQSGEVQ
jgi:hypothetical protein